MDSNSKKLFWDLKPYWCQPWSIIVFGLVIVFFSWLLFKNITISVILGLFVILWWVLFLIIVPNSYQELSDREQS